MFLLLEQLYFIHLFFANTLSLFRSKLLTESGA